MKNLSTVKYPKVRLYASLIFISGLPSATCNINLTPVILTFFLSNIDYNSVPSSLIFFLWENTFYSITHDLLPTSTNYFPDKWGFTLTIASYTFSTSLFIPLERTKHNIINKFPFILHSSYTSLLTTKKSFCPCTFLIATDEATASFRIKAFLSFQTATCRSL